MEMMNGTNENGDGTDNNFVNNNVSLKGNWLALDTATDAMTIAIFKDGMLTGERTSPSERNHSNRLLPAIQELTTELKMPMRTLNGIVVGQGPGSYTGIRIGVTVAKTLAWSLRIPLIPISSLEAMAYGVLGMSEKALVIPMIDARRGRAYTALYRKHGDTWTCDMPDGIKPMDQFLDEVKGREQGYQVILTGDVAGFQPLIASFREEWQDEVIVDERSLQAAVVGQLAMRYGISRAVPDAHRLLPNYTQLSEPEKNFQR